MVSENTIAYIAAGSALSGVVLSQIISIGLAVFEKKHKKNVLLRQKYEEMLFLFQDSLRYVQDVYNCESQSQLYQLGFCAQTNKSLGLALLYFPGLVEPLSKYSDAQLSFYHSVVSIYRASVNSNVGAQVVGNQKHKQALVDLSNAQKDAIDEAIRNAKKYTKA
jgi:hypothetical protein